MQKCVFYAAKTYGAIDTALASITRMIVAIQRSGLVPAFGNGYWACVFWSFCGGGGCLNLFQKMLTGKCIFIVNKPYFIGIFLD